MAQTIESHPGIYIAPEFRTPQKLSRLLTTLSRIATVNEGRDEFVLGGVIGKSSNPRFPYSLGFTDFNPLHPGLSYRISAGETKDTPYVLIPQK